MPQEHLIIFAARLVEMAGVAALLVGAILAAVTFARRLVRRAVFEEAYLACVPISAAPSCWGWSCW